VNRHALDRSRLAWLDRYIVPRETLLAQSPASHRPQAVALYQTVVFGSAVVGPLLGGWLADTFGFHVIFGASGAGRFLGILLYVWLAVRPALAARGAQPATSPAGAA
jgi:MFS family permease